jgi:hypothetical protein
VNLDENSMLELKQNNPFLNAKDEIAKLKKSKQKKGPAGQDVEMENGENESPQSKRRSRADFESSKQALIE